MAPKYHGHTAVLETSAYAPNGEFLALETQELIIQKHPVQSFVLVVGAVMKGMRFYNKSISSSANGYFQLFICILESF